MPSFMTASFIKKWIIRLIPLGIVAALAAWFLSAPQYLEKNEIAKMEAGDASKGESVFWPGGCGSCHAVKNATGDEKKKLGGGHALKTPVGTFYTPNISPDNKTGIGNWTGAEFANAMVKGVSPNGSHYFPSFPYTSYARMNMEDIADLWAYMKTLPVVKRENESHDLSLLFSVRRGVGLWKTIFLSPDPVAKIDESNEQLMRGRYLVEGAGHCAECHTPRSLFGLGGTLKSAWLSGGPSPEGIGKIPNITPHSSGSGAWSADEISEYLATGFTPDFDSVGGSMVSVQQNMAKLTKQDRDAIAAYLKAIAPIETK
ncbi:MAG: cytochrome c [Nitratireductor sp.]